MLGQLEGCSEHGLDLPSNLLPHSSLGRTGCFGLSSGSCSHSGAPCLRTSPLIRVTFQEAGGRSYLQISLF